MSVIAGAMLTAPLWLYQIWAFITPGLRKNERRYTLSFIIAVHAAVRRRRGAGLPGAARKGLHVLIGAGRQRHRGRC